MDRHKTLRTILVLVFSLALTRQVKAQTFCPNGPNGEQTTYVYNFNTGRYDCITTISSSTILGSGSTTVTVSTSGIVTINSSGGGVSCSTCSIQNTLTPTTTTQIANVALLTSTFTLTVKSGSAPTGATDRAPGDVILETGLGTGYTSGSMYFKVSDIIGTAGPLLTVLSAGVVSGYTVGDVLTLAGAGDGTGQITIDTVDGGGNPLTWHVSAGGNSYSIGEENPAVSGGTGTGFYAIVSAVSGTAFNSYVTPLTLTYAGAAVNGALSAGATTLGPLTSANITTGQGSFTSAGTAVTVTGGNVYLTPKLTSFTGLSGTSAALGAHASPIVKNKVLFTISITASKLLAYDITLDGGGFAPAMNNITTNLSGPNWLDVKGDYAYVTNATSSLLAIFDVSNPKSMVAKGTIGTGLSTPTCVKVQGNYAAVTSSATNSLVIYDVSNPSVPILSTSTTSNLLAPTAVEWQGNNLFVTGTGRMCSFLFDPVAGTLTFKSKVTANLTTPVDIAISGTNAFIADTATGIVMFDIGNLTSMTSRGVLNSPFTGASRVYTAERYLYAVTDVGLNLYMFDVFGANSGAGLTQLSTSGATFTGKPCLGVALVGQQIYVVGGSGNDYFIGSGAGTSLTGAGGALGTLQVGNLNVVQGANFASGVDVKAGINLAGSLLAKGNIATSGNGLVAGKFGVGTSSPTATVTILSSTTTAFSVSVATAPGGPGLYVSTTAWTSSDLYVGRSSTVTVATGTGAGSVGTPTASVTGTNNAGILTVNTATTPSVSATIATITTSISAPTKIVCTLSPGNATTALLTGASMVVVTGTANTWVVTAGTTGLTGASTYVWNYICMGY